LFTKWSALVVTGYKGHCLIPWLSQKLSTIIQPDKIFALGHYMNNKTVLSVSNMDRQPQYITTYRVAQLK